MSIGLSIKITGTLIELMIPYILSHILKNVVAKESVKQILLWGLLMIACAAAACLFNICANRMAAKVSRDFSENIRHELFAHTCAFRIANGQIHDPLPRITHNDRYIQHT